VATLKSTTGPRSHSMEQEVQAEIDERVVIPKLDGSKINIDTYLSHLEKFIKESRTLERKASQRSIDTSCLHRKKSAPSII